MAPVATHDNATQPTQADRVEALKSEAQVFNPFYSPSIGDDGDDKYEFAHFKVIPHLLPLTLSTHLPCSRRSRSCPGSH
jgi:hypothetical protein